MLTSAPPRCHETLSHSDFFLRNPFEIKDLEIGGNPTSYLHNYQLPVFGRLHEF